MQKVLLTGANGFLGYYLCRHLLAQHYEVVATGRGACRLPFTDPLFTYQHLDFTEKEAVGQLLVVRKPSIVVHAGALTKPDECELNQPLAWQVNVEGTAHLLEAAASVGAYFLYLSTDFVFAGNKKWYTEADPPDPVNFYGKTKAAAESLVRQYKGAWSIARPILLYGPPQTGKHNLLTMVAHALSEKKELKLFTDQLRLPTYIEDLTFGLEKMIALKMQGIYHFCGNDALSPYDIGIEVARYLHLDASKIYPVTAAEFYQPAARPQRTMFYLDKVHTELGFQATSFADGMRKTLEGWNK